MGASAPAVTADPPRKTAGSPEPPGSRPFSGASLYDSPNMRLVRPKAARQPATGSSHSAAGQVIPSLASPYLWGFLLPEVPPPLPPEEGVFVAFATIMLHDALAVAPTASVTMALNA
jgi:hypothetical protein